MLLSVADIVKVPGESIPFAFVVGGGDILDGDEGVQLAGAVRLNGKVANIGEGILELTGTLDAQLDTFCDRCLRPIVVSFEAQLLERFSRTLPENEEEEIYLFENDKLDLKQMVRDSLLLNMPTRHLCSEDCLGLCPVCGRDLNHTNTHCSCLDDTMDKHPMAALKALLNDDEEV